MIVKIFKIELIKVKNKIINNNKIIKYKDRKD